MREMKDSGIEWIGEIPKEWQVFSVKYLISELINCYSFESSSLDIENNIPVIRIGDIQNESINISLALRTTIKDKILENYIIKNNDILIALSGATVGKLAYINQINEIAYINQRVAIIRSKFSKFIYYYLSTNQFIEYILLESSGTAQPNISNSMIKNYSITFPNGVNEVNKIVNYLDNRCEKIDRMIAKEQEEIEKLKEYKQSIITEAVIKGLNTNAEMKDSGIEWIDFIPKAWNKVKLKYETNIRARLGWKGLKAEEYVEKGYPLLSAFNIVDDKLNYDNLNFINQFRYDESPEIKLSVGDVILVKDGAGIGKCAYIDKLLYPATVNGSLAVISSNKKLSGKYLYYYFKSKMFQQYIDRLKDGMGVPHLFQRDLKEIEIPFPSKENQECIVSYLDAKCENIDKTISKMQLKIEKIISFKKSLIYECVTGKKEIV